MKSITALRIFALACLFPSIALSQKKITVLGSSTAAGNGASVIDSCWVHCLQACFRKNTTDGMDTVVNNRAVPGYVTYQSLPTGYPTPPARPLPDPNANVTYVLNEAPRPDVVIINYPTNDIVSGYATQEMMDNLRLMYQLLTAQGILVYITTTQPRNTASDAQRILLRQAVDSIQNTFGLYSIDFWDDIAAADGTILPLVNADGTHVNDIGHRLLFQRVQAKNIFSVQTPLPLVLKDWQAWMENNVVKVKWTVYGEEPNTSFEVQRSSNGKDFKTAYSEKGIGSMAYSWEDASPAKGKSFYRLKIIEQAATTYSKSILVLNNKEQALIGKMYLAASGLHLSINSPKEQSALFNIISLSGACIKKQSFVLTASTNAITLPVGELASGQYFLQIITSEGATETKRFSK